MSKRICRGKCRERRSKLLVSSKQCRQHWCWWGSASENCTCAQPRVWLRQWLCWWGNAWSRPEIIPSNLGGRRGLQCVHTSPDGSEESLRLSSFRDVLDNISQVWSLRQPWSGCIALCTSASSANLESHELTDNIPCTSSLNPSVFDSIDAWRKHTISLRSGHEYWEDRDIHTTFNISLFSLDSTIYFTTFDLTDVWLERAVSVRSGLCQVWNVRTRTSVPLDGWRQEGIPSGNQRLHWESSSCQPKLCRQLCKNQARPPDICPQKLSMVHDEWHHRESECEIRESETKGWWDQKCDMASVPTQLVGG